MASSDDTPVQRGAVAGDPPADASFADAFKPVRLAARDTEDVQVFSAMLQDAIIRVGDMTYLPKERRFAFLANRFRWEEPALRERVRVGVHFDGVLSAQIRGFKPADKEQALSLLAIEAALGEDAIAGRVRLLFSGEAEVALQVEALDAALADIGRPWSASAKPLHRG
ncbi:MAG: DUF2948 family protein [Pseudomonadota bacterium]